MNVEDLIKELKKHNPKAIVYFELESDYESPGRVSEVCRLESNYKDEVTLLDNNE